jgi:competence protein ComEA
MGVGPQDGDRSGVKQGTAQIVLHSIGYSAKNDCAAFSTTGRTSMRQPRVLAWVLFGALALGVVHSAWAFVDANTASAADLASIKGLGPSTSQRLVQTRQTAPFKNWDDLIARMPGVGPATAQKLSAGGLRIQGLAYEQATSSNTEAIWRPMLPKPLPPH